MQTNIPLRPFQKGLLFSLLLLLLFNSCQKEESFDLDSKIQPQASLLGESRLHFNRQIEGQRLQAMPNNPRHRVGKTPLWEQAEAVQLSIGAGFKVPLRYQGSISLVIGQNKQAVPLAELSYLLVYKDQQGRYRYEVVTQIPDADYWAHRHEAGRSFSGIVIVEDWWGRPIKTFKKTPHQQIVLMESPRLGFYKNKTDIQNLHSREDDCDLVVSTNNRGMYEVYFICDLPGSGSLEDNSSPGGFGGFGWGNSGGGFKGGGGPNHGDYDERPRGVGGGGRRNDNPQAPERNTDIVNNLPEGCLKYVINELIQKDCKNELTTMMNETFNVSAELDLIIDGRFTFSNEIDADASTQLGVDGYCKINIDLNMNILPNAAKEYIAATMFHESIHAYLAANSRMSELDHQVMAELYISKMISGIKELYPNISLQDAEALSWGGLQETSAWASLQISDPMKVDLILRTNANYRNGNLGSICDMR